MNAPKIKNAVIQCALMNGLFSQEYADAHFEGEESEDNALYQWEDEFLVREVYRIEEKESTTYDLSGIHPVHGDFSYPIVNMRLVLLYHSLDNCTPIAVSESLLHNFTQSESEEEYWLNFELKDDEPFINPIVGVYISNKDIPRELKNA
ncbi:MAG: hypothetical protein ACKO7O_00215 [Bacteroidota bacterium]